MKANEAPEKLYLFEGEPILSARSKKLEGTDIEYIRTDVFLERACTWLRRNFDMPIGFEKHLIKAIEL